LAPQNSLRANRRISVSNILWGQNLQPIHDV
jgi:hypothetical protein